MRLGFIARNASTTGLAGLAACACIISALSSFSFCSFSFCSSCASISSALGSRSKPAALGLFGFTSLFFSLFERLRFLDRPRLRERLCFRDDLSFLFLSLSLRDRDFELELFSEVELDFRDFSFFVFLERDRSFFRDFERWFRTSFKTFWRAFLFS